MNVAPWRHAGTSLVTGRVPRPGMAAWAEIASADPMGPVWERP
jgi:hypothetical protein